MQFVTVWKVLLYILRDTQPGHVPQSAANCWSRGREFYPSLVPFQRKDIFYGYSPPSTDQEGLLLATGENMGIEYLLKAYSKLAQDKCG